jgi:membrane peptidoglycan carboxypeptidase
MIFPASLARALKRAACHSCDTLLDALHPGLSTSAAPRPSNAAPDVGRRPPVGESSLDDRRILKKKLLGVLLLVGLVLGGAGHEVRTSALQSWFFSRWAARLTYHMGPGPSPRITFPEAGPFDQRLGYTRIPEFTRRLEQREYRMTAQARFSDAADKLAHWGILPPYQEPALTGLVIRDAAGATLYDSSVGHGIFRDIHDVPPLLAKTLLFIENRRLQEPSDPRENPVVDWARLAKAGALYTGRKLGLPFPTEGGSTLATQVEKFQHSQSGRTSSPAEKIRQMMSASLKVYQEGADTRIERRQILLQYLNTMPLAAAPGWGEVNGLGDGLVAWFGVHPAVALRALAFPSRSPDTIGAYKRILTLLCAVRAPTYYLVQNRAALETRVRSYATLLQQAGVIDQEFARRVRAMPVSFLHQKTTPPDRLIVERKAMNHLRVWLGQLLGESNLYNLDRLHLEVDSLLDLSLQRGVATLLDRLRDPDFLATRGLIGDRLLGGGDPRDVVYSFLLLERTSRGNVIRVHTDTLDDPFDINSGMKMELGSTAKLRTLAHYLELVSDLYEELSPLDAAALAQRAMGARDPLTRWAAETLRRQSGLGLAGLLQQALDRTYSASPAEVFFTGGGAHTFVNYDRDEDRRVYSVRDGLIQSVNLVYIRLMRDIVRFHEARLSYDAAAVLSNPGHPVRRRLLTEIAEAEATGALGNAYREYRGLSGREVEARLLGRRAQDPRRLAILFFAWHGGEGEEALGRWLDSRVGQVPPQQVHALAKAYGNPTLSLPDFGFLLGRHPLEVWCAGEMASTPGLSWTALRAQSPEPIRATSTWLFKTTNRRAQDLRLRIRIEQDAFARMAPSWRRLGFPFEDLVPSLATAIGSSSDRPDALAELMGIILNDGVRLPTVAVQRIRFAAGTPYETVFERAPEPAMRVMSAAVARTLRPVLAGVATRGTARRLTGAFVDATGAAIEVGGKTGSGDNRYKTFAQGGAVTSARPVSRTATFAFYVGDRYFGVVTASVTGGEVGKFHFTSALPVAILKLLAPGIQSRIQKRLATEDPETARVSPAPPSTEGRHDWHSARISSSDFSQILRAAPRATADPRESSIRAIAAGVNGNSALSGRAERMRRAAFAAWPSVDVAIASRAPRLTSRRRDRARTFVA